MFNIQNTTRNYTGKFGNSSFWLDDESFDRRDVYTSNVDRNRDNIMKLVSIKRAITNFVKILTNQNIPVVYKGKDSWTDGKSVVLSADVDTDRNFDATVGLALHESSHIVMSDFKIFTNLANEINAINSDIVLGKTSSQEKNAIIFNLKQLLNWIEDRRIDNYIYEQAPGYRGYYEALYKKYFFHPEIEKMLKSDMHRTETIESYMSRIINLINPSSDLTALKGLKEINDVLDLQNIGRLKDTHSALKLACDVYVIIEKYLDKVAPEEEEDNKKKSSNPGNGTATGETTNSSDSGSDETQEDDDNDEEQVIDEDDIDENTKIEVSNGDNNSSKKNVTITANALKKIENILEKQKDFLNSHSDSDKKNVSNTVKEQVNAIEKADIELKSVGQHGTVSGNQNVAGSGKLRQTNTVVINNFNKSFIDVDPFNIFDKSYRSQGNQAAIENGLRIGAVLGRKLQIRNEERTTKYTRLNNGRIDKRLIAGLGYGAEQMFEQTLTSVYKKMVVYISVDASGSMAGTKFTNCLTAVSAIAKAADMIQNLDVVINFRQTTRDNPVLLNAYDSRVDKLVKLKTLMKYVSINCSTPEGLCFEAIMDKMVVEKNTDVYFINFSDGAPEYSDKNISYFGDFARTHTKNQVKAMTAKGIKVLSYFISTGGTSGYFTEMYGKNAKTIDVTAIIPLAKSLNELFLKKDNN